MNLIICVDKTGGMLFNKRRVSRDQYVTADILKTVRGEKLLIHPYSTILFEKFEESFEAPLVCDDPMETAGDGEWCFIENQDITPYLGKVEKLLIYNWNTRYPFELAFDLESGLADFKLSEKSKFKGHSHDEITRCLYRKTYGGR